MVTHEIWRACGYRFVCVAIIRLKKILSLTLLAVSRIILVLRTDIKRVCGAVKTKLARQNHEVMIRYHLESPHKESLLRGTDIPVKVA